MSEQPKYIRVFNLEKANEKVLEGYKIQETIVSVTQEDVSGHTMSDISYLMYLSSFNLADFKDFTNAEIGSLEQKELETDGYVSLANYSKHITWAKPKVIPNE